MIRNRLTRHVPTHRLGQAITLLAVVIAPLQADRLGWLHLDASGGALWLVVIAVAAIAWHRLEGER